MDKLNSKFFLLISLSGVLILSLTGCSTPQERPAEADAGKVEDFEKVRGMCQT